MKPTHLVGDSSSCIDLRYRSQPDLVLKFGVHSSWHPNCHHQITYAKFNLKIPYTPRYEWEIWHYGRAIVAHIRKAIKEFTWERSFEKTAWMKKSIYLIQL